MKNIGRVRPQVRPEEFMDVGFSQLGEIFHQVFLGISPCEICVRLRETELGELIHDVGAREGFGQKDEVRMLLLEIANHPFPEIKWLRVWIVDPENVNALPDPEFDNVL